VCTQQCLPPSMKCLPFLHNLNVKNKWKKNLEKQWKTMEETTLNPSLHLGSPNHELSFELHFLV
jgi:hypothetical protein